jgi:hypothetical protein
MVQLQSTLVTIIEISATQKKPKKEKMRRWRMKSEKNLLTML